MGTYIPHTDDEVASMLAFLGLDSLDELFAVVPEALRLQRGLELADGVGEPDVLAHLEGLRRPQPGSVRPTGVLRRGRRLRPRDPSGDPGTGRPLRVRDLLHALPARGGPGRPPGRLRVPDHGGPTGRAAGGQRLPLRRGQRRRRSGEPRGGRLRAADGVGVGRDPPPLAPDARHLRPRAPVTGSAPFPWSTASPSGPTTPTATTDPGWCVVGYPNYLGLPRGPRRRPGPVRPDRCAAGGRGRSGGRRTAQVGGGVGGGRGGGGGTGLRHRPRVRWSLPRTVRLRRSTGAAPARPAGGGDRRRRGPNGLRHHAPRPRAGHPAREGDVQRLHQPDPHGGDRGHPARVAGDVRPGRGGPPLRSGHPLPREASWPLDGVAPLADAPVVREFAVRLPVPAAVVIDRMADAGFLAGIALERRGRRTASTDCSWRSPSGGPGTQIDAYATALAKAVA